MHNSDGLWKEQLRQTSRQRDRAYTALKGANIIIAGLAVLCIITTCGWALEALYCG